ncbi:phage terminase small subunit P27 family [Microvirga sp. KLBC 81]|uniref:phage terminase small subunit P27 family n=1 Tax=Microvirga sp. KLBC 81 TaxID=1862707 RepID=UPI000D521750|nr:phage terminase small subunit P27 family [Microvirga sp. KLBC 81]PVE25797.1 phage terminase small subunit P27 family [Microvirga sp. KLBC 81]
MRGRKPKPTRLKLIEGNPGKRPLNPHEPQVPTKAPTCPSHLNPTAKAEWKRLASDLHRLGILTEMDRAVLAAYCQAYGRWVEAERKLKETPLLIKLPSGYIQQSPWLAIANKQLELMHKYLAEFGLSPASRTRVEVRMPQKTSKFAGLLGRDSESEWMEMRNER